MYGTIGGLVLSIRPDRAKLLESLSLPYDGSIVTGRRNHPAHKMDIGSYFGPHTSDPATNLTLIDAMPMLMIVEVGNHLKSLKDLDWSPMFEFLRCVRNAIAHDNRIFIHHSTCQAEFDGTIIGAEDNGRPLKDFVLPGDMLALLEAVEVELRKDP